MNPPTIRIFGKVGDNPMSMLGETRPEVGDSEVTVLYTTARLLHAIGDMFEQQATQTQRDLDEIEGLG